MAHKLLMSLPMLVETKVEEVQSTFITKLYQKRVVALIVDELHFGYIEFIIFLFDIRNLIKHFFKVVLYYSGTGNPDIEILYQHVSTPIFTRFNKLSIVYSLRLRRIQFKRFRINHQMR